MASTSTLEFELDAAYSGFLMEDLRRLGAHLPLAWIEEALAITGTASIRLRRLPAEQVVWLVIAQARQRLGSEPLAVLFNRTAPAWCNQDGPTFRTPDSPENRAFFGAQGYVSGKVASYPHTSDRRHGLR